MESTEEWQGGGQGLSVTFIRSSRSFHVECCSISCSLTLTPLPVLLLHAQMELHDLLKPISDHIQEIQNVRERNRGSSLFNHLSAISESIPALGWVAVVRKNAAAHTKRPSSNNFYTLRIETQTSTFQWFISPFTCFLY